MREHSKNAYFLGKMMQKNNMKKAIYSQSSRPQKTPFFPYFPNPLPQTTLQRPPKNPPLKSPQPPPPDHRPHALSPHLLHLLHLPPLSVLYLSLLVCLVLPLSIHLVLQKRRFLKRVDDIVYL